MRNSTRNPIYQMYAMLHNNFPTSYRHTKVFEWKHTLGEIIVLHNLLQNQRLNSPKEKFAFSWMGFQTSSNIKFPELLH